MALPSSPSRALPPIQYLNSLLAFREEVTARLGGEQAAARDFGFARHRVFITALSLGGPFGLLVSGRLGAGATVLTEAVLIIFCLVAALGIAHDASHGAMRAGPRFNRLGALVFDFVGVSSYIWHFDHVVAHHYTPNISRYDANLYGWGPVRLDPRSRLRFYHRYQHLYAPLLYGAASLFKVYPYSRAV